MSDFDWWLWVFATFLSLDIVDALIWYRLLLSLFHFLHLFFWFRFRFSFGFDFCLPISVSAIQFV